MRRRHLGRRVPQISACCACLPDRRTAHRDGSALDHRRRGHPAAAARGRASGRYGEAQIRDHVGA
jgi:hypothetical protein